MTPIGLSKDLKLPSTTPAVHWTEDEDDTDDDDDVFYDAREDLGAAL